MVLVFEQWAAASAEAKHLFLNFIAFAFCFSVNHGTVGALINLSTTLLGSGLGSLTLGTLYCFYVLSALTTATFVVSKFGAKGGLMAGTAGYCLYVCSFLLAAQLAAVPPAEPSALSCAAAGAAAPGPKSSTGYCTFTPAEGNDPAKCVCQATELVRAISITGAAFGGISAGSLWTAQGAYFSRNAALYAQSGGAIFGSAGEVASAHATGLFASIFAVAYLMFEVVMKLLSSILSTETQLPVFAVAAVGSAIGICLVDPMPAATGTTSDPPRKRRSGKLGAAMSMLTSYRPIQLLVPTEMVFGFSAAMMNSFVNGSYAPAQFVGYFGTLTTITAALVSSFAGWYTSQKKNTKTPLMVSGNLAFFLLGLIVLLVPAESFLSRSGVSESWTSNPSPQAWLFLLPLYVLQGIGRGVFESTNKAVIADYCPGEDKKASGFACFVILSGAASILAFFLIPGLSADRASTQYLQRLDYEKHVLSGIVIGFSALALLLFPLSVKAAGEAKLNEETSASLPINTHDSDGLDYGAELYTPPPVIEVTGAVADFGEVA